MKKILFLIWFLLLFQMVTEGAPPSSSYTYTSGSTIKPDEVQTNENNLYRYVQVGVDTYADSSIITDDILDGTLINADISGVAAIVYSKLSLGSSLLSTDIKDGEIVNADINASAEIVDTKLATISTASKVNVTALTGTIATTNLGSGTASSANFLRGDQSWSQGKGIPSNVQVFTSSGTWTKPAGIDTVYVKLWGGGGAAYNATNGGGGGGAGYCEGLVTVTGDVTVTVGTGDVFNSGGDSGTASTFEGSTTLTANGGSVGVGTAGGAGGTATNGSINITGQPGGLGATGVPGDGGDSPMGGSGGRSNGTTGKVGTVPGGGSSYQLNGADGLVIVYY